MNKCLIFASVAAVSFVSSAGCAQQDAHDDCEPGLVANVVTPTQSSSSPGDSVRITNLLASTDVKVAPLVERYLQVISESDSDTNVSSVAENDESVRFLRQPAETTILSEIRQANAETRVGVLNAIVAAAEQHPTVLSRIDDVTHAVVGLDAELRSQVLELIVRPRCEQQVTTAEQRAAVCVGLFLKADELIPNFVDVAVPVIVTLPRSSQPIASTALAHQVTCYAEQYSPGDSLDYCRLLAVLPQSDYVDRDVRSRFDAELLEQLVNADPRTIAQNYLSLLVWLIERQPAIHSQGRYGLSSEQAKELQNQCADLLIEAIKENPNPAVQAVNADPTGQRMDRLVQTHPQLFDVLPERIARKFGENEKKSYLAALQGQQSSWPGATWNPPEPGRILPRRYRGSELAFLRVANKYYGSEERRQVISILLERLKTSEEKHMSTLLWHLSPVAEGLTPEECTTILASLESTPFGDEKPAKNEPSVDPRVYSDFVASLPSEALDEVTRWLFKIHISKDRPSFHYCQALAECAEGCQPRTAAIMLNYISKNYELLSQNKGSLGRAMPAIGKAVPEAEADVLAKKLITEAKDEPDLATVAMKLKLAGYLVNSDPNIRYVGFEMLVSRIEYDPESTGNSSRNPKDAILKNQVSPAMADITSGLSPETSKKAYDKIMATLTGDKVTEETMVLIRGLAGVAGKLSQHDAEQAFELIGRLNAADRGRNDMVPQRMIVFMNARDREEWLDLITRLLSEIEINDSRLGDTVNWITVWCSELSSSAARELLFDLYERSEPPRSTEALRLHSKLVSRIGPDDREAVAQGLHEFLQLSQDPYWHRVIGQSVAELGRDVSKETRVAVGAELLRKCDIRVQESLSQAANNSRVEDYSAFYCFPLGELLRRLPPETAAPLRDRLVRVLCRLVYQADALPANPEIQRLYRHRLDVSGEVAAVLGNTQAAIGPEAMDTILFCVASFGHHIHPVRLEKVLSSLGQCQGVASPGVGVALVEQVVGNPDRRIDRDFLSILSTAVTKVPTEDVSRMYSHFWNTYRELAESEGRRRGIEIGDCMIKIGRLLPPDEAWSATEDVVKQWSAEERPDHRAFLKKLYATLFKRLSEVKQQAATQLAEPQGLAQETPNSSRSRRSSPQPEENITIEDLADEANRLRNLDRLMMANSKLSLAEKLDILRKLDDKGYFVAPNGEYLDPELLRWFLRDSTDNGKEDILALLAAPENVGLLQRFLLISHVGIESQELGIGLWELEDLVESAP